MNRFEITSSGAWWRSTYAKYHGWIQVKIFTVNNLNERGTQLMTFEASADSGEEAIDAAKLQLTAWLLLNSPSVV